jgi:hypothetical protein
MLGDPHGRRDPLDPPSDPRGPCTFGLAGVELVAEARRCRESGWQAWEIVARLARPDIGVAA